MGDKIHREKNAFMFLCDQGTESECLRLQLLGTTQMNAVWAMNIKEGDELYLFNFNTGTVYGPFTALSGVDCHDPNAWGGNFPVQVKMRNTELTRRSDVRRPNAPSFLRNRRPSGDITKDAPELFTWLQNAGEATD